jgi:SAM-dependent methyltransferase
MIPSPTLVTAAEISRLASVTRATVSNWRRRHADFPAPVGGTASSPAYDLEAVRVWLAARNQLPQVTAAEALREQLRSLPPHTDLAGLAPVVVAANGLSDAGRELLELTDEALLEHVATLTGTGGAGPLSGGGTVCSPEDARLIRGLLRCVAEQGPRAALEVLAERTIPVGSVEYLPPWLAELMVDVVMRTGVRAGASILDPACGAGTLLSAAADRGFGQIYGQDLSPTHASYAVAGVQIVAPAATARVVVGDSIRADGFLGLGVDAVVCAPPFGDRRWGHDEVAYDARWVYGLPPSNEAELAWVQHCLSHLSPGGWAVLLLTPAVAQRASGRRIRAGLVRAGALRAVIALPPGAAAPAHVGLHLWVLQQPPTEPRPAPDLLLVDASAGSYPGLSDTGSLILGTDRSRSTKPADWADVHATIAEIWSRFLDRPHDFTPTPGLARTVGVLDLLDDNVDLTPARQVRGLAPVEPPEQFDQSLRSLRDALTSTSERLAARSRDMSWMIAPSGPTMRQSTPLADLLIGQAVTMIRPSPAAPDDKAQVQLQAGDVVLPQVLANGAAPAHVVGDNEPDLPAGATVHVLRPDPERLDSWFLAGFLSAEDNQSAASTGSTVLRLDIKRLRVPLMPLAEQRRFGRTFRHLQALQDEARHVQELAARTGGLFRMGLTSGALAPLDPDEEQAPMTGG